MTITEFVLARIAEREKIARSAIADGDPGRWEVAHSEPNTDLLSVVGQFAREVTPPAPRDDPRGVFSGHWYAIAEWEADGDEELPVPYAEHIAANDPRAVLAECQAKRRIVEGLQPFGELDDMFGPEILRILAAIDAHHPDYQQEWAPGPPSPGYDAGYRDGESSMTADWMIALDDVIPDEIDTASPSKVAAYIATLQAGRP